MKTSSRLLAVSCAAILAVTFAYRMSSAAGPTVNAPVVVPGSVSVGQLTQLSVTSLVVGTTPNPILAGTVNLLRVDAADNAIATLGVMHDDGAGGDAIAGDSIYTLTLTITEPAAGSLRLRLSAGFRGLLKRVLSPVTIVPVVVNRAPTANAGPDQTATIGSTVHLDGSASSDPDGNQLNYHWVMVSRPTGSVSTLSSATDVMPTFIPDRPGSYDLELAVDDGSVSSIADTVRITTQNSAPVADAGPDQTASNGASVHLNGSGSSDVDGDTITFAWSFNSRPVGSTATLSDPTAISPTFVIDSSGSYVVQLTVTDPSGASSSDLVTITTQNSAPVANAGSDQSIPINGLVQLDGSGSTDVDGNSLTYSWSLTTVPNGSAATLSGANVVNPTFTADRPGIYVAQLIVNDGNVDSTPDTVIITTENSVPIAHAGPDQTVSVGSLVQLDGGGSTDADADTLTYQWSFVSRPQNSSATLIHPTQVNPSFFADQPGNYVVQLIVNDGHSDSVPDTVALTTGNSAPVANAGADIDNCQGRTIQLSGAASSDADGNQLSYNWSLATKPAGSSAQLVNPLTVNPTLTADLPGIYVAQLIVNDGVVDSEPDTVVINFKNNIELTGLTMETRDVGTVTVTLQCGALESNNCGPDHNQACGGQLINLSSNNATIATVDETVVVPAGTLTQTANVHSNSTSGTAVLTAFAPGFFDGIANLTINNRQLSVELTDQLIGIGPNHATTGTVTLARPAPAGGATISVTSGAASIAAVSTDGPPCAAGSLCFAEGTTSRSFTASGLLTGIASITATGPGYTSATTSVTVTSSVIHIPSNFVIAPEQALGYPISLSDPAPTGGVTVTLNNSNSAVATLPSTVFIPEGATAPITVPQITGGGLSALNSVTQISASAPGYAHDIQSATLRLSISFSPSNLVVLTNKTKDIQLDLSAPAPSDGLTINLTTDDGTKATVPASVSFAPHALSSNVTVAGHNAGSTTLRASGTGIAEATASITVNPAPAIFLNGATIGKNLQASTSGSLAAAAPAGNVQVTICSGDVTKALLSTNATTAGSQCINLQVNAGSSAIPTFFVQALADTGTVQLTATSPDYADGLATVTLIPAGFRITTPSFTTTSSSPNTAVGLGVVALNPGTLTVFSSLQVLRPGVVANVPIDTADHTVGVMTTSPVVFNGGDLSNTTTSFDPIGGPNTTIVITQPAGFTAPAADTQITVTVTAASINLSSTTVGKDLQIAYGGSLGAPAPAGNTVVTIQPLTAADRSKIRLSNFSNLLNDDAQGRVTITVGAGNSSFPTNSLFIHALAGSGTVQIRVTAPGYTGNTATITLVPSGFVISNCSSFTSCGFPATLTLNTTSLSSNTTLTVYSAALNPTTLAPTTSQAVRAADAVSPMTSVNASVTSGTPAVGTITVNPVVFNAVDSTRTTAFDPVAQGTTLVTLGTPSGFSTPAVGQQISFNVAGPRIFLGTTNLGRDLQQQVSVSLESPAPAGNLQVTITSADANKLKLSTSATTVGSGSVTLTIFAGSSSAVYYIQSLDNTGTVQLTGTANNYTTGTSTVTLVPSGFVLSMEHRSGCFACTRTFNTTTLSTDTSFFVYPVQLTPALAYSAVGTLRAGVSASVGVLSGTPGVGSITTSPVLYNANELDKTTAFHPLTVGTSTISVQTPVGFSTPTNLQTLTATVALPTLSIGSLEIGKDMQATSSLSLGAAAPAGGVTVTLSVADPSRVRLSTSASTLGDVTGTLTLTIPQGQSSFSPFYVQSLNGSGTVQYTASAPGFNSATQPITLVPSGFLLSLDSPFSCLGCSGNTFTTTTTGNRLMYVSMFTLDPTTLNHRTLGSPRAGVGPITVNVLNDNSSAGSVSPTSVSFNVGDQFKNSTFQGLAPGTSVLSLSTPTGFTQPSDFRTITATVTAPPTNINISSVVVGKDLQTTSSFSLGSPAGPGGVQVVITTDPTKALLTTSSGTVQGTGSITFNLAQGQSSGSFVVQGLVNSGTAQLNVTASGYTPNTATATFRPSGFVIGSGCIGAGCLTLNTNTLAANSSITVQSAMLDPTTLNYQQGMSLRGGISPVNVDVTSDNSAVGTIVTSPVVFNGNESQKTTPFDPLTVGSTIIRVIQPSGFSTPSNLTQITANVVLPNIFIGNMTIGKDLQVSTSASLGAQAPAGGVTLVISVNPALVRLSTSQTVLGDATGTISFNIPAGQSSSPAFFVQALAGTGVVQWTASAGPNYNPQTNNITLMPSGFTFQGLGTSFNTTVGASNTTLTIVPGALDPLTLNFSQVQQLRPGMTNTLVDVYTEDPNNPCGNPPTGPPGNPCNSAVGTITVSPLQFNGADVPNSRTTSFHPVAVGSTVIKVKAQGFSTASNNNNVTANVN